MMTQISVIIANHNNGHFFADAYHSLVGQTFTEWEAIVIDDASTDATLKKINSFSDERIKVVPFAENTQKVGAVNEVLKNEGLWNYNLTLLPGFQETVTHNLNHIITHGMKATLQKNHSQKLFVSNES